MKKGLLILPLLLANACVKAPTIDERLAGKTGAAREEEAYDACLEESRHYGGRHGHSVQSSRFWALCDEMKKLNEKEK